jgi:hypothetical protein
MKSACRVKWTWIVAALLATLAIPAQASAFCGFYVGGAGAELFADATQVVLMRDGTTTVLSMQNRYSGPLDDFAMVVPVPQVLMQDNVKTLPKDVFDKIDTLTSPRLVEYWEKDPCGPEYDERDAFAGGGNNFPTDDGGGSVTVEAQFEVGEYQIEILSATDSTALDDYLIQNNYNVPTNAGPYYQPYIDEGMYFFVAKVDSTKVSFDAAGNAVLSPLRFNYDSPEFSLPIRLGMINSSGQQDLIVYTLAKEQRYEVANYDNVFIPTNIEVVDDVRNDFPSFYKALFARTLKENPGAAVTEYSWNAATCDPCPGPVTLQPDDIATLGGDVIDGTGDANVGWGRGYVVTRLHMRYDKDEVGEDLVFRQADPVVGGREIDEDDDGEIDQGAFPGRVNNFQGRYIIRHPWDGAIACADPVYGRWGGPEGAESPTTTASPSPNTTGDTVFNTGAGGEVVIEEKVREDVPEIGVQADTTKSDAGGGGGGCSSTDLAGGAGGAGLAVMSLLGLAVFRRRRV